jgi:hypothetical protein
VALLQVAQAFEEVRALLRHAGLVTALVAHAALPDPGAKRLELKVEWVEPGGKMVGLINSSRAHRPDSGLRPLVSALPNTSTSGVTPKCSIDHSLPVRQKPIWISSTTIRMPYWSSTFLRSRKKFFGGIT